MLTVTPIKSASGAAEYYSQTFDYYQGDSQAIRWLGKGCHHLGLSDKEVTKEKFLELLEGHLPDGSRLQNKKGEHRPGFDMTYSAPKSLSVLVGLGVRKEQLLSFHDKAVELAAKDVESEFAQARINQDGKLNYVHTGNLISAAFRQPSSRENDPQIHTHVVTPNITFDDEGKARSLASDIHRENGVIEQLQNYSTYAGQIYRTYLANMLKDAGYKLTPKKNGLFEIEGMPDDVLKQFSKRSEQIKEEMEKNGWSGSHGASQATLNSRSAKEEHDINKLQSSWLKQASELGFDANEYISDHFKPEKKTLYESIKDAIFTNVLDKEQEKANLSYEAVGVAIESLSQSTSVFDYRKLKEAALRHTLCGAERISIEDIDKAIQKNVADRNLYMGTCPISKKPMLTTPWVLTQETETLTRLTNNKDTVKPIASLAYVIKLKEGYEKEHGFKLTPSQEKALIELNTTSDRFLAVQGYAGTGKTTILKLSKDIAFQKGYEVKGVAVQSSVVDELHKKAGIESELYQKTYKELMQAKDNSLNKTIYVLDEASMLSTTQTHQLVKLIEQKGARLVMVGDDAQLPTVKNGRMFGLSQDYGISTVKLNDIIRQKSLNSKQAVYNAIGYEVYDSVQKLSSVKTAETHLDRVELIASEWLNVSQEQRNNTLVFAPTHKDREAITALIREQLIKDGELGDKSISLKTLKPKKIEENETHYTRYYEAGDVIRFNKSFSRYDIKSGDYFSVGKITKKDIENNTLQLKSESGDIFTFNLKYLPKYQSSTAGMSRYIELYEQKQVELAEGDRIQWTRNSAKDGVKNSTIGFVEKIDNNSIHIKDIDGKHQSFNFTDKVMQHVDYGYALTTYKVQGKEKMHGIGLLESFNKFSATIKNYYVQISRAVFNMTLVTDDKEQLIRSIDSNDDNKKSAIDFLSENQINQHAKRFEGHKNAINIGVIVEQKISKDNEHQKRQHIIDTYKEAMKSGDSEKLSKSAYEIIDDRTTQRMANSQVGIGYGKLRRDALSYATERYKASLSPSEQEKLSIVERYFNSSKDASKAWAELKSEKELLAEDDQNRQHDIRLKAIKLTCESEMLAHTIFKDSGNFRPFLKHFSIGDLNRFGVPQYKIEEEAGVAKSNLEKLANKAESFIFKREIDKFFSDSDRSCKQQLGLYIQQQSKRAHSYIVELSERLNSEPSKLWHSINVQAKLKKDNDFKSSLSEAQQEAFEHIKQYKEMGRELAKLGINFRQVAANGHDKESIERNNRQSGLLTKRNDIALKAISDPSFQPVLKYFNLDNEKLKKQALRSEYRSNIEQFVNAKYDFKKRYELADAIRLDIKGHYPFIKELEANKSPLNKYIRVANRLEIMANISDAEKEDYKDVINYRCLTSKTSQAWKSVFSFKETGQKAPANLIDNALILSSKRDAKGHQINNKPQYKRYIEIENIAKERLNSHSQTHHIKLRELKELHEQRQGLLLSLEQNEHSFSEKESRLWHSKWDDMVRHIGQVKWAMKGYGEALKVYSLADKSVPKKHRALLNKYDIPLARYSDQSNSFSEKIKQKPKYDLSLINESLMASPVETYKAIFGEPKSIRGREMRYSGGLIVTVKGAKSGLWYDHISHEGGSPINAIMRERSLNFKEALNVAAELAGAARIEVFNGVKGARTTKISDKISNKNAIESAKSIWKGSRKIEGTIADKYLKQHRGIAETSSLNVRFWPVGAKWVDTNDEGKRYERVNKIPALIIPAYNKSGYINGVQRIYLDKKTSGKVTFMDKAKVSKGLIKGCAGIIQKGDKNSRLYIAEGPETAASIAQADKTSTVLVAFGLGNISNLKDILNKLGNQEVFIAGDNDLNTKVDIKKATLEAAANLQKDGINAMPIFPDRIDNKPKTDWNDVHIKHGINALETQLKSKIIEQKNLVSSGLTQDEIISITKRIGGKPKSSAINNYSDHHSEIVKNISIEQIKSAQLPKNVQLEHHKKQPQLSKENTKEIER